jgi:hypothetical protein
MPGNVQSSTANGVMPSGLLSAFSEDFAWRTYENSYPDGASTRGVRVNTSQRRFRLKRALSAAQFTAMMTFLQGQRGRAFYFYHLLETVPINTPDPSGSNPVGRYLVTLESDILYEIQMPRTRMEITLRQVA